MSLLSLFPKPHFTARRPAKKVPTHRPALALPLAPIPLPAPLKDRLMAVRRRYRLVFAGTGLFILLGAISLLFLFQGLADWWFDLPWAARAVFFLADIILLGSLYYHHLHQPLQKKLGLAETALMVEKNWPSLRQCLITAVQLAEGRAGSTRGSRQLVDLLLEQARTRTSNLDFRAVVSTRPLRRWALLGGGAWAVLLFAAWSWPASGALLERIFLLNVPLPTKTIVVSLTRDFTVPVSSDVEIVAQARGLIPTHGRVTVTYEDETPREFPLTVLPDRPATFSLTVHNVQKPFKYRFHLNDGQGPEFIVTARVPPAIGTLDCVEVYPSYTRLPPQKLPSTALTLLAGSYLQVKAVSTESLKSATVILQGVPRQIPMTLDSTGTQLEANIPIPAKDLIGFSLHLVDEADLASSNETVYPIDLVLDKPPVVKIVQPDAESETITLRARPVIAFEASDDYGLIQLNLDYEIIPPQVAGDEATTVPSVQHIPIPIQTAREGTHYEYTFDVAAQNPAWHEGDTVNYWIEAVDNNTATGPGITRTEHKQFGIITPEAKQAEILSRIQQNAADIDTLSGTQQKISHDVGETIPQK